MAIDDTLFRRRGKKVWAASWFHDGTCEDGVRQQLGGRGRHRADAGAHRPVAIPVLAKHHQGHRLRVPAVAGPPHGRSHRRGTARPGHPRGRRFRLRRRRAEEAPAPRDLDHPAAQGRALYGLPPERTGRHGRPREKSGRLSSLAGLAATAAFTQVTVA